MHKVQQQMKKAKNKGLSPMELLQMKEIAQRSAKKMESEAIEKSFLFMLAIPLNVLFNDYWQKTAKQKAPKFIAEVLKLYEAVQDGIVSEKELNDLVWDLAGVKVEAEWLARKGETDGRC